MSATKKSNPVLLQELDTLRTRIREIEATLAVAEPPAPGPPPDPAQVLRESEARLRLLVDSAVEGIYAVDLEGTATFCNQACLRMLGQRSAGELLGKNMHHLLHQANPDDLAERGETCRIDRTLQHGQEVHVEDQLLRRADGTTFAAEYWAQPVIREGEIVGAVVTLLDVTNRREAEKQRLRFDAQAQGTHKLDSLSVLAGGIAHDFNNLLLGVLANAGMALERLPAEHVARENLEQIETEALRAADLAKRLLAFSGKAKLTTRPLNLAHLLKEIGQVLRTSVSEAIEVEFNLMSQLPLIEGDPTQIRQVMMHLLSNASDAIGDAVPGRITVGTGIVEVEPDYTSDAYLPEILAPGTYIYATVTDSGVGMDEPTLHKIFDPFYTTKSTGHGLGLAAVLGIMQGHRGAVQVESRAGAGTTFKVFFPCSDKKDRSLAYELVDRAPLAATGTILVVDDEETVRDVTKRILVFAGFDVLLACDGIEGVRVLSERSGEICLVILDMRLPRMGGAEAFRKMRQINPKLPILLASGYDPEGTAARLIEEEHASFLLKPYSPQDLTAKVSWLLGSAEND